ncbi:MAG: VlmB-like protein [Alteromonadaceae bacterium]|nr:MAG: VlmB-like protein [Alteromonadaceae bacterium]
MFNEANWDQAPGLTEGALNLKLDAKTCDLNYWIKAVAQGTWMGLENGHRPGAVTPAYMQEAGPLRDALYEELAFRTVAEHMATRALPYLIINAPTTETMEFYLTQTVDEARHSAVFRGHLFELGVVESDLPHLIETYAREQIDSVLKPLEAWMLEIVRDNADFLGGVVLFTILIEGLLAPAAEISERKWRLIDPAGAEIEKGANIDEIRHLTVGASIIKEHLEKFPEDRAHVLNVIKAGVEKWESLPTDEVVLRREKLFQEGMMAHKELLESYELIPGVRLIDTTPEQRLDIAVQMTKELQIGRLNYMNLEEAIDWLV